MHQQPQIGVGLAEMKMKELRLGYQDLDFRILSLNRKP